MEVLFFVVGFFLQFVLEVLGAGGAIWGMSEVWHMRGGSNANPFQTNEDLTIPSNIVFALGFIRMICRYTPPNPMAEALVSPQDWSAKAFVKGGSQKASADGMFLFEFLLFLLGVYLQWVLEVLGAGGACWGMSEVWHLRADTTRSDRGAAKTNDDYRWVANTVFCIATFRMLLKYCPPSQIQKAHLDPNGWIKSLGKNKGDEDFSPEPQQEAGSPAQVGGGQTEMANLSKKSANAQALY